MGRLVPAHNNNDPHSTADQAQNVSGVDLIFQDSVLELRVQKVNS